MRPRLEFHEILCEILGSRNVYFQPPANVKMSYPAIVYRLDYIDNNSANNKVYIQDKRYQVIVIDKDPDSVISDKVSQLPQCTFDRNYTSDNLNHFSYTIYY